MSLRGKGGALVLAQGNRILGLASARQRSGPRSWEVSHLFAGSSAERGVPGLLERASQAAASHGGERIFLRLHREDTLVDAARLSGFFPRVPETLYSRQAPGHTPPQVPDPAGISDNIRQKTERDNHDLFRLYNAATPSEIRYATGMTLEQWISSRERPGGRSEEFVLDGSGPAMAWLRVSRRWGKGQLEVMVHREESQTLPDIVDFGLGRLRSAKVVQCLVAEHQVDLQRVLMDTGFVKVTDYITLVHCMTLRARKEEARLRAAVPTV